MCKFQFLLIVCTVALSLLPSPITSASSDTIDSHHIEKRMFGTTFTEVEKAPFVVAILAVVNGLKINWGGILITPKCVLSFRMAELLDVEAKTIGVFAGCSQYGTISCPHQQIRSVKVRYLNPDPEAAKKFVAFKSIEIYEVIKPFTLGPNVSVAKFNTDKKGFASDCKNGTFYRIGGGMRLMSKNITLTNNAKSCLEAVPKNEEYKDKTYILSVPGDVYDMADPSDHGGPLVCDGYVTGVMVGSTKKTNEIGCTLFLNIEGLFEFITKMTDRALVNITENPQTTESGKSDTSIPNESGFLIFLFFAMILALY